MAEQVFDDPVLQLALRCGDYPSSVLEFADTTDEEARQVLEVLDEVEADEKAAGLAASMRRAGQLW